MQSNLGLNSFLRNILEERHEPHNFMVTIETKGFGLAHERLVRELCTHLHNFLLLVNCVFRFLSVNSRDDSASRLELIMEFKCACWKACEVARVVEYCAKNVVARVIGRTAPEPIAFGTMHPVKYPVVRFV